MSTNYTAFLDFLMPEVPGCSTEMALQSLSNAIIEFCQDTRCFTYEPAAIDIVANQRDYTLTPSSGNNIVDCLYAAVNGDPIFPATDDMLDIAFPPSTGNNTTGTGNGNDNWRLITTTDDPPAYYQFTDLGRGTIRLIKTPSVSYTGGLTVKVALTPLRATRVIPDTIYENHVDDILHGAKAILYAMPRKPWSDPVRAQSEQQQFNYVKGNLDAAASRAFTRAPLRSKTCYR